MGDDFSALELDADHEEEMLALFGMSSEPAIPSFQGRNPAAASTSSLNSKHPTRRCMPPPVSHPFQAERPTQSLLCITNKRPAADLHQSWPHKSRHSTPAMHLDGTDTSYDELELDNWGPDNIVAQQANSSASMQQNAFAMNAATPLSTSQAPAGMPNILQARTNSDSQATELWQSAYSRLLQASQASVSLQRAAASQQTASGPQAGIVNAVPRQLPLRVPRSNISAAMVCKNEVNRHCCNKALVQHAA